MAHPTAVILVVGLNRSLIGDAAPNLVAFARRGTLRRLQPVLPAVTCSVQSSMLTGLAPRDHGIVGNGWYDRTLAEVHFWKQSNRLVCGQKVWDIARQRDPTVTVANLFWWFNMYSGVDYAVAPRPCYKADGRKIPDVYTTPADLRDRLQQELGTFPLFRFWGPGSSIESSRWIASASRLVHEWHRPTLMLIYLPHLDYALQRLGPRHEDIPAAVGEIDDVVGRLIEYLDTQGVRTIIASEYGIEAVEEAVHINRFLRREGLLAIRDEQGAELLDAGASDAFAVADHQVAHVYVRQLQEIPRVADLCRTIPGIEKILDLDGKREAGLDHNRAGDLVLVADCGRWFSYDYWLDDSHAPDFARTVDIHRKPGYDPLELFIDPTLGLPRFRVGWKLLRRRLGFRTLMDVIPLDTSLVRGSHGRVAMPAESQPVLITACEYGDHPEVLPCEQVKEIILEHLFED